MRKEVIYAILAGGLFGLIIAFGVWRLNKTIEPGGNTTEGSPTPKPSIGITIAKPNNLDVVTDSKVTVSGISKPNSFVILSLDEDYLTQTDSNGEFSIEVELSGGINEILISSFSGEEKNGETVLTLVYSSEFEKYLNLSDSGEDEEESTESAGSEIATDSIKDKVVEKVKEITNKGVAYVGSVTDISENTFQLDTQLQEIALVSTSDETVFVNNVSDAKTINFEDVAIGDYILAMGFRNGNEVLESKRVVVVTKPENEDVTVNIGKITEIGTKTLTLDENKEMSFGKSWKGPDLDELEEGQTIITVEIKNDDTLQVRSIFVAEAE